MFCSGENRPANDGSPPTRTLTGGHEVWRRMARFAARTPVRRRHSAIARWTAHSMQPNRPQDLVRTTLQLIALGALMLSSFWIVRPFLVALTWAVMIAVSTWPLLLPAQARRGGRRSLAVAVMTIALLLVLLVPFYFRLTAILGDARQIADWSKSLGTVVLPQPPAWLAGVPAIGSRLAERWHHLAETSPDEGFARL